MRIFLFFIGLLWVFFSILLYIDSQKLLNFKNLFHINLYYSQPETSLAWFSNGILCIILSFIGFSWGYTKVKKFSNEKVNYWHVIAPFCACLLTWLYYFYLLIDKPTFFEKYHTHLYNYPLLGTGAIYFSFYINYWINQEEQIGNIKNQR